MITELKPTNLISVEVPEDANNYTLGIPKKLRYNSNKKHEYINFEGNFKIIGEVTKDKIGFDVIKLGEVPLSSKEEQELLNSNDKIDFRKLLAANGLTNFSKLVIFQKII